MYKNSLGKKNNINSHITTLFSGKTNKYANYQLNFLEHLNKELEARKMKASRTLYRKKLIDDRNKENYYNEIHRLRGVLSQNDTRLPIGTRERLENRIKEIKNLKYNAFDDFKDIN